MNPNAVAAHDDHDDGSVHAHVSPAWFLWAIFGGLIALTALTVGVSYVDFGSANTVVAVVVATMKASLVAAFFMHLKYDKAFNTLVFVSAFVFLFLFLMFTREDVEHRGQINENGDMFAPRSGEYAPGGMGSVKTQAPGPVKGH